MEHALAPAPEPGPPPLDAVRRALAGPVAGPPLRSLARPGMQVTIAVTDATRPSPDHLLVPALLDELAAAGVAERDVTVLFALGMHRPTTPEERAAKLGPAGARVRTEDADGARDADYLDLGMVGASDGDAGMPLPQPVPIRIHHRVARADLVLATGVVEPHQYAGYSGGRKTVAVGCAGAATISVLHGLAFLEHPGTRLGSLVGNPVHAALEAIARRVGPAFVLNVALDGEGGLLEAAAGPPGAVLERLAARLAPRTWVPVGREPFDAVIAGVGAPKDANLYQASRALTYLVFSPEPAVREGGWVVLPAPCPEGAGRGPGEAEFLAAMRAGQDPDAVVAGLRRRGFGAGGQRAFMVARALQRVRALVVASETPEIARDCGMATADSAEEAVGFLEPKLGPRARVLVVPHALAVLPVAR